ncbi:MAG: aspartate-semialdehyde dehydrogenase [Verrucomicrobia bacterium]|nr:aspartate-semialdehyde dehydrogenase [Verrucomicrobiota bacterium]
MSRQYHVAVVGATGAVGVEMIKTLEKRNFPVGKLSLFASARSKGKTLTFRGKAMPVHELTHDCFTGVEIALFSAGASRSREFADDAVKAGAVVIDNSSAFRMDPNAPLVVPEINPEDIKLHKGIIANPNCSTIIMLMPLWPLHRAAKLRRVIVSTYQAASGAGAQAMAELEDQTRDVLAGKPAVPKIMPHRYAFNLFSHNTAIAANGYNEEENKMVKETWKILHDDTIKVCPTCIRVPVLRAHSESIVAEFEKPLTVAEARELLAKAPGLKLVDDRERNLFPMPIEATEQYDCLVGRIRQDLSCNKSLALFVAGDQLLKGAALNAVQIAEVLARP